MATIEHAIGKPLPRLPPHMAVALGALLLFCTCFCYSALLLCCCGRDNPRGKEEVEDDDEGFTEEIHVIHAVQRKTSFSEDVNKVDLSLDGSMPLPNISLEFPMPLPAPVPPAPASERNDASTGLSPYDSSPDAMITPDHAMHPQPTPRQCPEPKGAEATWPSLPSNMVGAPDSPIPREKLKPTDVFSLRDEAKARRLSATQSRDGAPTTSLQCPKPTDFFSLRDTANSRRLLGPRENVKNPRCGSRRPVGKSVSLPVEALVDGVSGAEGTARSTGCVSPSPTPKITLRSRQRLLELQSGSFKARQDAPMSSARKSKAPSSRSRRSISKVESHVNTLGSIFAALDRVASANGSDAYAKRARAYRQLEEGDDDDNEDGMGSQWSSPMGSLFGSQWGSPEQSEPKSRGSPEQEVTRSKASFWWESSLEA